MAAAAPLLLLAHTSARLLPLTTRRSSTPSLIFARRSSHRPVCRSTSSGSAAQSSSFSSSSSDRRVEPPNLTQLCEKARLHLTPDEIADFTPKIASVVDWFSQLQDVDVENVAPAIRVGEVGEESTLRADLPAIFEGREAMLSAAPEREGPFLKVPRILKETSE